MLNDLSKTTVEENSVLSIALIEDFLQNIFSQGKK